MIDQRKLTKPVVGIHRSAQPPDLARHTSECGGVAPAIPTRIKRIEIGPLLESHVRAMVIGSRLHAGREEVQLQPTGVGHDEVLVTEPCGFVELEVVIKRRSGIEGAAGEDG